MFIPFFLKRGKQSYLPNKMTLYRRKGHEARVGFHLVLQNRETTSMRRLNKAGAVHSAGPNVML